MSLVPAMYNSRLLDRDQVSIGALKLIGLAALPILVNVPGLREVPAWSLVIVGFVAAVFFLQYVAAALGSRMQHLDVSTGRRYGAPVRVPVVLLLLVLVTGYIQAVFRGAFGPFNWISQCLSVVSIVALAGTCIRSVDNKELARAWMTPLLIGATAFILVNMALLVMGVSSVHQNFETVAANRLLRIFGISINRMAFPISGGQNATAIICVLILAVALAKLAIARSSFGRLGTWLVVGLCVISILLTDARGGYLGILGLVAAYNFRRYPGLVLGIFIASATLSFLPIIVKFIASWLPVKLIFDLFGAQIPRSFDAVGALTTGRNFIWEAAFQNLISNPISLLFGYGIKGHYTSGVSLEYGWLFGGNPWHTLHSWILQGVFEFGIVGLSIHLGVFIWICVVVLRAHSRAVGARVVDSNALACTLILLGFVICGANESVLSSSFPDHYIFYGICLSFALQCRASASSSAQAKQASN